MLRHPHDHYFRWVFSKPAIVAAHVRHLLPVEVAESLRWDRLRPAPESLLDQRLKGRQPDLHFEIPGRRSALVRLLYHHQSTSDPFMALRLFSESARVLERWRAEHPRARRLPWVLPIVVHHGARPWRAPLDLRDLLAVSTAVRKKHTGLLPSLPYVVQDLAVVPEEALVGDPLGALALRLLKHAHRRDLWRRLPQWADLVRAARDAHGLAGLNVTVEYMINVCPHPGEETSRWIAEELGPEEATMFKSWAQELHEQGLEQGLERGLEQGLERGLEQGLERGRFAERRDLLSRLLCGRFGAAPEDVADRIHAADDDQINRWIDGLFLANSLDELLSR